MQCAMPVDVVMKLIKEIRKKRYRKYSRVCGVLSHMAVEGEADFYAYTRECVKTDDYGGLFHINSMMSSWADHDQ